MNLQSKYWPFSTTLNHCTGLWLATCVAARGSGFGHKKVKCFLSHHKEGEKSLPIVEVDFKYIKSNAKAALSTLLLLSSQSLASYRLDSYFCKQNFISH